MCVCVCVCVLRLCYPLPLSPTPFHPPSSQVAGCFEYYAGLAEALDARQGEGVDLGTPDFTCSLRREPLGVVALITPWNYPRECLPPPPPTTRVLAWWVGS